MRRGGFDVVVGNPPWIYLKGKKAREVWMGDYDSIKSRNMYGLFIERSLALTHPSGTLGFIVESALPSSAEMETLRGVILRDGGSLHVSTFDDRPAKLFKDLTHCRSAIAVLNRASDDDGLRVSPYVRWASDYRPHLIDTIAYSTLQAPLEPHPKRFPKARPDLMPVLRKLAALEGRLSDHFVAKGGHPIIYQDATQYYVKAARNGWRYSVDGVSCPPKHCKTIRLRRAEEASACVAAMNSTLFYVYYVAFGNFHHLKPIVVDNFPTPAGLLADPELAALGDLLAADLSRNSEMLKMTVGSRKGGGSKITEYEAFTPAKSKPLIDRIDDRLAAHYGLTPEQAETVKTFDLKFRTGGGNY